MGKRSVTNPVLQLTTAGSKRDSIINAARDSFLRSGYAGASMDAIAAGAGVSVKTIYSHFHNKGELFSAVMKGACTNWVGPEDLQDLDSLHPIYTWFTNASLKGLTAAGQAYLDHLLSEEQLALYRVVTRDAARFPELGEEYQKNIARGRIDLLIAFLSRTARVNGWGRKDFSRDALLYEALLRAGIFEQALHGLQKPDAKAIRNHTHAASQTMWKLLGGTRKQGE